MRFFRRLSSRQLSWYEGFPYHAGQLSAYLYSGFSFYIISLRNGDIIRHYPPDVADFARWLDEHKVRNVMEGQQPPTHQ